MSFENVGRVFHALARGSSTACTLFITAAYSRSANAVCDVRCAITCSGVPSATSRPPASPPSGPRSMIQSAERITSRLCSMMMSEWPASSSLRSARISLAMSSKCRPVVGSSNKNSVPLLGWRRASACLLALRVLLASAKKPASFRRWASPPDSVGTGWPSLTYSSPTSTMGCRARTTSRSWANSCTASLTVRSSTSATFRIFETV